jgi:tape measure domain-containing protein
MAGGSTLMLKLGIDVSNLSRELGKVESQMARFGNKMQNVGSTLSQSLTLPIIALGGAALKSFADMERLELGLTAIMGSSAAAAVELEKLRKTAENPGLALPQVVQASSTLQAVGLSADAARETILQFGNATARAGKGAVVFDELIFAFSKIQSTGKITQESINQIAERLPGFSTLLQQTFGASTAEGINATGISAEDFSKKTVEALSNLQRAQGGLGNSFDNLTDNITASLAELGKVINTSLNVDAIFIALSDKLNYLVQGFKKLNPETQGFIVYAGLIVAAIGPAIFIVGKMITTFGALAGTTKIIIETFGKLKETIIKAFTTILANPAILGITLAIAAIGAIALYVYDNWQAFADNFKNIWINIKNSVMQGVAFVLGKLDNLQKALGLNLFDLSGMTQYQEEQRVVATRFKTIGETVDSLKGKLASLFTTSAKAESKGGGIIPTGTTNTGSSGGGAGGGGVVKGTMDATNLLPTLNLLPAQLKSATAETDRLKESTNAFKDAQIAAATAIQYSQEKMNFLREATKALTIDLKQLIDGTLSDIAVGFGEQLGKALSGAKFEIKALLLPLADAIIQFGKMAIQAGITALAIKKALTLAQAPLAIAAGIALIAIGSAIKNGIATPKLAEGGLAFGPTMATVGDNRNAGVDPEVIAPLSKLKSMMGDMGVGGTLETRISGNDLIILLNRSQKGLNRIQ